MIKKPSLGYSSGRKPSVYLYGQKTSVVTVLVLVLLPQFLRFHSTLVPVPTARYQDFDTRFSGDYLYFSHFGTSSVSFRYHFDSKSGGTSSFAIGTLIDWNLDCLKFSVPQNKRICSFDIFSL